MQGPTHDRRRQHHRTRPRPLDPSQPITLYPGQLVFRLLCHVNTVGGVIGSFGSVVRNLEGNTGAKIRVEPTFPNCLERVINVIGYSMIDRKITFEGNDDASGSGSAEVSQAQECLVRVFERVLEVESSSASDGGVIGCRLLAGIGQVGPLLGRRGSIVDTIRKNTGTKIRVLPANQLPSCASPSDELIQIMGGVLAVKKALLAVSCRLQFHSPLEKASTNLSSYELLPNPHSEFLPHQSPMSLSLPSSSVDYSIDYSMSADVDRMLSLGDKSTKLEVVFRLLCSAFAVGGVIGKGATVVRALEKETGASIKMAAPVEGSNERVATVSAMENPEPLFSPAQNAIIRVFSRSVEVGIDRGHVARLSKRETVTARLLVASNQVDCLIDRGGSNASDIITVSDIDIQILGGVLVPNCAGEDDKVIQIIGEYENVKTALFQVTGRLRDNLFTSIACGRAGARNCSGSAVPVISPYKKEIEIASPGLDCSSGISRFYHQINRKQGMDHGRLLGNLGCSASQQSLQAMGMGNVTDFTRSGRGLAKFGDEEEHRSLEPAVVENTTLEVLVSKPLFDSIYGENGSNLARLKQISGAKVTVHDPCPGENKGKVTITGTPDQTQIARSLIHAFVLTVQ